MKDNGVSIKGTNEKGSYHIDKSTKNLGVTHAMDTLEYNLRHAEDHLQKARETCEKLDKIDPNHNVPVTKSLQDLMDYFEKEVNPDLGKKQKRADNKLNNYIKESY